MSPLLNKIKKNRNSGFSLIEVLVALAIIAAVAVAFLLALNMALKATSIADIRTTAESLARTQLEYTKTSAYDATNNPPIYSLAPNLTSDPSLTNYTVQVSADRLDPRGDGTNNDDGLQFITVTVSHSGELIFEIFDYKSRIIYGVSG